MDLCAGGCGKLVQTFEDESWAQGPWYCERCFEIEKRKRESSG